MLRDAVARLAPQRPLSAAEVRAFARERWYVIALALITLAGFAVRVIDVADNPRGFFTDEASFGWNAYLVMTTGKDEHGEFLPILFRSFGEYKLPAFIYAEIPFMAVLGRTELAVRVTAAFIGSLTLVTTYLLGREVFRRHTPALLAAGCLAILPWHIHYSRTGLGDIVTFPLFFTFGLFLFFRALREGKSLIPAAVVFGLTFYTYRSAWMVVPPILAILILLYTEELLKDRRDALYAAAVIGFILLPIVRHLLSDTSDRSSQAWIFNIESERSTLDLFWSQYKSYFTESFLFDKGDNGPILRHFLPGQGELYKWQLPLLVAGVVTLVGGLNRRYVLLLALLPVYPLTAALSDTSPISSRSIMGSVTFAFLTAAGVWGIIQLMAFLARGRETLIAGAVIGVVGVFALFSFEAYLQKYHDTYPAIAAGYWGWQDGPQAIMAHFLSVQDRYDQMFLDGEFNAPIEFIVFYNGKKCPKCFVGATDRYDPARRQLFALRPKNINPEQWRYEVKRQLYYPSGELAFIFVEILGRR